MTWEQFMRARQLIAEETVGSAMRAVVRAEDAQVARLRRSVG